MTDWYKAIRLTKCQSDNVGTEPTTAQPPELMEGDHYVKPQRQVKYPFTTSNSTRALCFTPSG